SRGAAASHHIPVLGAILLGLAFSALALAMLRPALRGAFINDDYPLIVNHPYLRTLDAQNLAAILDPFGDASLHGVNYAPVMLLSFALEKAIFGLDTFGYHVVNVVVHGVNGALLAALLTASGIPRRAALLGALLFVVHPANVEAVAWISQLKTELAFAFALGALLAQRRFPAAALALFALGLLTKASALAALPTAAALSWSRRDAPRHWWWLGAWTAVAGLYAIPELHAQVAGEYSPHADAWMHARSIAALGARYLAMAATSYGVSAFQEPEPARSLVDPWWLAGVLAAALLGARTLATLRARKPEAAFWIAAAASFAPISQIWTFMHPFADRYLYFILPGLIGGGLFAALELRSQLLARQPALARRWAPAATRAALVGSLAVALVFAARSHARAALWTEEIALMRESARNYPNGANAAYYRALLAAERGDAETAVRELRECARHDIGHVARFSADPRFAPIARDPAFHALVDEIAGRWIEFARERGLESQTWLRSVGQAHRVRGEYTQAIAAFERALRGGGPLSSEIAADLQATRALERDARARERR
ncbi:MAG TPA: hypothetical protein VEC18_11065, partial [Myxococcota bacterium]|nr:hypothetical protein [Myxococcota bacterium]